MESAICHCQETSLAWCSVLWHPAIAKGVGARAEDTDAMDGDGGNDSKAEYQTFQDSVKVCKNFENKGFANCILKGQGNALLYPDPYMRTPGDIDIYLSGGRRKIMKYVDQVCPNQLMRYHHVDFPVMKTAIEVHFTPSYMFCPIHNRIMQKWFEEVMGEQCNHRVSLPDGYGEIHVPQVSFNVIYILSHLYRHIFTEGIGLRQLLDYYFVLVKWHTDLTNLTDSNKSLPRMTQIWIPYGMN